MNTITVTLFGLKYEQMYYDINTLNSIQIQEWISSNKSKLDIDSIASQFTLLHTIQLFDPEKTWITIKQNDELLNIEPYPASDDCFFNQIYGTIDSSTYNDGIVIDPNCQAVTTNPEQWHYDAQKIYDYLQEDSFISPLCSIILSSMQNSIPADKEFLIKTTSYFSVFEYTFSLSNQFDINNLCFFIDPYPNYYTYTDSIIPDFILYDEVFRCGGEIYSMPIKFDWAKCLARKSMDVISEYEFKEENCATLSTVLF